MSTTYTFADALHDAFGGGIPTLTAVMATLLLLALVYAVVGEIRYRADEPVAPVDHEPLPDVVDRRAVVAAIGGHYGARFGRYEGARYSSSRRYGTDWHGATYDEYDEGGTLSYGEISRISTTGESLYAGSTRADADSDDVLALIGNDPHEGILLAEIPSTTTGDYVGSTYSLSNHEVLLNMFPDTFIVSTDAMGARTLWLPVVGPLVPAALVSAIDGLADYPVVDEMHLSDTEHELATRHLAEYGVPEILDELTSLASNEVELVDPDDGARLVDADDYTYAERVSDIDHDEIVAAIDALHGVGTFNSWVDEVLHEGNYGMEEFLSFGHNDVDSFDASGIARLVWDSHHDDVMTAVAAATNFVPVR